MDAEFSQGMGRLNDSLKSYDDLLARNQSNVRAWHLKGHTLSRIEIYNKALACYDRASEIDPGYYQKVYAGMSCLEERTAANEIENNL
ncbi:Tetratricopeptide repeat protein [uncultured archaeon]|nr:Tetratricopeptide repeat protein [uncultured archaeon]